MRYHYNDKVLIRTLEFQNFQFVNYKIGLYIKKIDVKKKHLAFIFVRPIIETAIRYWITNQI